MNGRFVLLTVILLGCAAHGTQNATNATAAPTLETAGTTQQSLGVNYYLQRPDKRSEMIDRCDRAHGKLTTLHLPGERALDCESAISALAHVYSLNSTTLHDMLHRCDTRKDERELFSECRAAQLAKRESRA